MFIFLRFFISLSINLHFMKRHYFFATLLFTFCIGNSQIINIPDANFKAKLLASATEAIAQGNSGNTIIIDTNSDGEIQQSEALLVYSLSISGAGISDLTGIEYFTNMTYLHADANQLTSFSQNGMPNLIHLWLQNNNLTSIDFSGYTSLQILLLMNNQISSLSLTGFSHLDALDCSTNNLTSIDLTGCNELNFIYLNNNQLTDITFPAFTSTTSPPELGVTLDGNLFETITAPNHHLGLFHCSNNPNLVYLNVKDSYYILDAPSDNFNQHYEYSGCPNLEYICVRDADVTAVQNKITYYGYTNCHVNSYCSFTPGGTYYTLQGTNTFDSNNNGCDSGDGLVPNCKYIITDGFSSSTLIAGTDGLFHNDVSAGNYTITPVLETPIAYTVSPASANVSFPSAGSPFTQNFCITPNGVYTDLEVTALPIIGAVPGFDAVYKIVYKNKGTQVQNGTLSLTYADNVLDLVSAIPVVTTTSINTLQWDFTNLMPFETREIIVTFNTNSPLETPAVNGGDVLNYTATVVTNEIDATPTNNTSTLNQLVVNSLDPNDKTCLEGASVIPAVIGDYVHYLIRFENTGTANAQNIVVKDLIDTNKYDISSLLPISGSAPFVTRIINTNQVEFIFENINLPFDDATNDGYVAFKIKTKPALVVGDSFSNKANIYFDYNAPIVTNTATTTIQTLGIADFDFTTVFTLAPVPAKSSLTLTAKQKTTISSISIYNTLGQLVQVSTNPNETIDVSALKSGSYFIKIVSDKGTSAGKFIKE